MSNINEGIKDYLPRGGFFRDEDGNKQGGYIGQGTDEQLRKAKIIAKVKAYEAEPGKRFMAGRVSSEDLKNFDDFARRYEEYFGEIVDEGCGKKKAVEESDKEADDAEWKTIRKNAKANPSLYGGRYADKDAKKAKREWMKDKKSLSESLYIDSLDTDEDEEYGVPSDQYGIFNDDGKCLFYGSKSECERELNRRSKKSLEEDVNIDLADWGLEDLNETSEEMSVEPEEELDEMFFYDETEDEIKEERPLPKNRFKEDPEFYRHEDLEELRSKASDDDIDKVYRLSRDEVKDHNEWLKKHGKKNLMTEACKERKHKSWKKVVDSYYGKKAKSKLQESLENFESDYPEMEEFATIEIEPTNEPACEPCKNPEDCVCMNVPLVMRVLEFAKESNLSDEDLHKLVQKAVELCANGCCLSMDNYDELVACCQSEAPAEEETPVEPEMEQPEEDEEIDFSELMF